MHKWLFALGYISITTRAVLVAPNTTTTWQDIDATLGFRAARPPTERDTFLDDLVAKLTVPELGIVILNTHSGLALIIYIVHQLHLMFADNVIGPKSQNELYG